MNDIVREFLVESHESLAQLDRDLVTLEREPGDRETLARVFRTVHTVKGSAGFLGLTKLEAVSHAGESVLSRVRSGDLEFTPEIATALLGTVDAVRHVLAALEASGGTSEGGGDFSATIQTAERLLPPRRTAPGPTPSPARSASGAPAAPPKPRPADVAAPRTSAVSDSNVRVDVKLLDHLMTLVGELVLARNQLVQSPGPHEDPGFPGTVQRLDLITTELQQGVMKTRMQPVANVWAKLPRVVRDLAAACGKQVRLDMEGTDTELDRTIVEAVRDPLTHLVRNAVDHGIEPPEVRAARGKPAEGQLLLRAYQESGKVVIEITDDGGGIDPARVRDKALAARAVAPEDAARMSDAELLDLIFLPGLSTAGAVTRLSGRGVGMDVVRTHVERIGGLVEVNSRLGHGTTVRLRIPLTMAIIPALVVSAGGDRYAIPQVNLLELVRLEGAHLAHAVESLHGAPVYRLRGALLPLVDLAHELRVGHKSGRDELNVVVLQADDRRFGLVVEHIHDTEEIVVKPLQPQLKSTGVFSGATIMGDGRVALILDVIGLAQRAHVLRGARERARDEPAPQAPQEQRQSVLLFDAPDGSRLAAPTERVARIEELPATAVESVGGRDLVQYRGTVLPLIHLGPRPAPAAVMPVVVFAGPSDPVGVVVGRIVDIVDDELAVRSRATRPGVLFNAVVDGRITEVLDVDALTRGAASGFVAVPRSGGGAA
ncbi:chemotaxis protein CheW [Gemmata sp. JC717]|uniref:chemotaxis protein CheW n=1 Tax=Gemmata algarum TaxID=2975278 RepID=UPI0021BBA79F|nr:chemotaxis protein CheW [Gemmata algarum]MDY3554192.1 chemotaxis protein CheW [Gemmata algarum]